MRREQLRHCFFTALFFSLKVHADTHVAGYNIKIKQPKAPATYQVCDKHAENCKEMNAAEAMISKLRDESARVFKVTKTEVDPTQGSKGLDFDKK